MTQRIFEVFGPGHYIAELDGEPLKTCRASFRVKEDEYSLETNEYDDLGAVVLCVTAQKPFGYYGKYLYMPTEKESKQLYRELQAFFGPAIFGALLERAEVTK